jgi:hypothetical protein
MSRGSSNERDVPYAASEVGWKGFADKPHAVVCAKVALFGLSLHAKHVNNTSQVNNGHCYLDDFAISKPQLVVGIPQRLVVMTCFKQGEQMAVNLKSERYHEERRSRT